jgi:hypothetical protein
MSASRARIIRFLTLALPIGVVLVGTALPASSAEPRGLQPSTWNLVFDDVTTGSTSDPQTVSITNFQHGPVNVGQATLVGPHLRDFLISSDTCSGRRLDGGERCAYSVRFRPTTKGTRVADLKIPNDSDSCTLWVDLAGSGPNQEPAARTARCGDDDNAAPAPSTSPSSSTAAGGGSQAASTNAASSVIALPPASSRSCTSRRRFHIRINSPRGVRFTKVTVRLNKKLIKVSRGKHLSASISLKGLPRGRFTLRVVATTASGRTLSRTRHYVTCVANKG